MNGTPKIKKPPKTVSQVPGGIGRMRYLITLQSPTQAQDDYGVMVTGDDAWTDVFTDVFACVESLSGRELMTAQQMQADATGRVTLRYFPGVTTSWRVSFMGRFLNILSVSNPEERNVVLILMTSEYQK